MLASQIHLLFFVFGLKSKGISNVLLVVTRKLWEGIHLIQLQDETSCGINKSFDETKAIIDAAINTNSPLNGWAWRAVGLHKVMVDGQDDLAVVALLKALRCRDIEVPRNEALGIFYQLSGGSVGSERTGAFAELAMCYRRLGRFTAAILTFAG
jgi:hypothetical protein